MSEIQSRLAEINKRVAPIIEENVRLTEAVNKAIVVVWMGAAVFFGFMLSEAQVKKIDLINQEQAHVVAR